jgi:hypothetical protein
MAGQRRHTHRQTELEKKKEIAWNGGGGEGGKATGRAVNPGEEEKKKEHEAQ